MRIGKTIALATLVFSNILFIRTPAAFEASPAIFFPATLVPTNPEAGEIVRVNVVMGECHAVFATNPYVTVSGNIIDVNLRGFEATDPFCIIQIGTINMPIGAFPAGDYVVNVSYTYEQSGPIPVATASLGTIPMSVGGNYEQVPVPINNIFSLGALGLALILAASSPRNA